MTPVSEEDYLQQVETVLLKRAKAIRYGGAEFNWHRVATAGASEDEPSRVQIDITYRVDSRPVRLRAVVWNDRWCWLDARRSTKTGWSWSATLEGRFVGKGGAGTLIRKIEETMDITFKRNEHLPSLITKAWQSVLAQGPKGI